VRYHQPPMHKTWFVIALAACGATSNANTTKATTTQANAAAMPCGDTTCAQNEICIELSTGVGMAQEDTPPSSLSYRCSTEPEPSPSSNSCDEVKDRHQHCTAQVPAAPPHP
jgi:hypothetical protein